MRTNWQFSTSIIDKFLSDFSRILEFKISKKIWFLDHIYVYGLHKFFDSPYKHNLQFNFVKTWIWAKTNQSTFDDIRATRNRRQWTQSRHRTREKEKNPQTVFKFFNSKHPKQNKLCRLDTLSNERSFKIVSHSKIGIWPYIHTDL